MYILLCFNCFFLTLVKEQERKRVEEAGGHILCGRIAGSLAVSRALGDIDFKRPHNKSVGDWVVATPYTISLQLGDDDGTHLHSTFI